MRYILLIALNVPIILLALVNFVTQYKLKKIDRSKFIQQVFIWSLLLIILLGSFPVYNYSIGYPLFDSSNLDLFDIFQTTAIIYIIYTLNNHRRKNEQNERLIRDLHQELSIRLSNSPHEETKS